MGDTVPRSGGRIEQLRSQRRELLEMLDSLNKRLVAGQTTQETYKDVKKGLREKPLVVDRAISTGA